MKHVKISSFDCPDAWFKALNAIWREGDVYKVGFGSEETETKKLNLTIEIAHPENRPLVSDKAPCDFKYVQGYALEYLWCGEKKEDETYTYGSRLNDPINQVEEAVKRYVEEQRDRQVTMVIRRPDDIAKFDSKGNKSEPPCLSLIDTEILDGQMHLTCYFRSWDAYGGLPANIAGCSFSTKLSFQKSTNAVTSRLKLVNWFSTAKTATSTSANIPLSRNCWSPRMARLHVWQKR